MRTTLSKQEELKMIILGLETKLENIYKEDKAAEVRSDNFYDEVEKTLHLITSYKADLWWEREEVRQKRKVKVGC